MATKSVQTFSAKKCQLYLKKEAELDEAAQGQLLDEVEEVFVAKDNEMLEAEITDEEVRESLKTSNKKAAPGGDSITFLP